jgi:hypothetical protein
MARFYGTIQGARGPASRLGHPSSGLDVTAQSYQGDIMVEFRAYGDEDHVFISARHHGGGSAVCLYGGPVSALIHADARDLLLRQVAERALREEHELERARSSRDAA